MSDLPKITVLLAAYNRIEQLKELLTSVLAQDFNSFEVLVVDDGSDEETRGWLDKEAARQNNLRILHQQNSGVAFARQNGLREARGEFVCILDSDDRLVPNALSIIVKAFAENPETDLIYCNNRKWINSERVKIVHYPRFDTNKDMMRSIFLRPQIPFKHSGTTFRRNLALALGGYDTNLPLKIDIDLVLKFLAASRCVVLIEDFLVDFRMHKSSISAQRVLGIKAWWLLINRYGPTSQFQKVLYKAVRTFSELLKFVYLQLMLN